MEGRVDIPLANGRPWQADLCQFFTREKVAELCLGHVVFPKNLLSTRLLEPAAGQGAFFLPLLPRLVRSCRRQHKSFDVLRPIIRAYEIDARIAITLRTRTDTTLQALGVYEQTARQIARDWIRNEDFLEARPRTRFTHIVGNPPYIRWDAIPRSLRDSYKVRFASFKQRADLYVAFIEHALSVLDKDGQLGFLCPGTWTRNVYGGAVREAFTTLGQLKTIIDFSDAESFETPADAYPHFFVFQKGGNGPTKIFSIAGTDKIGPSGKSVVRTLYAPANGVSCRTRSRADFEPH
jgi:adenine-specific DNA-methyltransferase